jgi:hypothetical protein
MSDGNMIEDPPGAEPSDVVEAVVRTCELADSTGRSCKLWCKRHDLKLVGSIVGGE